MKTLSCNVNWVEPLFLGMFYKYIWHKLFKVAVSSKILEIWKFIKMLKSGLNFNFTRLLFFRSIGFTKTHTYTKHLRTHQTESCVNTHTFISNCKKRRKKFHWIGLLGQFSLRVKMSVCRFVCWFVCLHHQMQFLWASLPGNLETWKHGNLETLKLGNLESRKLGNLFSTVFNHFRPFSAISSLFQTRFFLLLVLKLFN